MAIMRQSLQSIVEVTFLYEYGAKLKAAPPDPPFPAP
jgi:hypothetical protein